ncbi:unnamed protein product, partial [Brenthis ino]
MQNCINYSFAFCTPCPSSSCYTWSVKRQNALEGREVSDQMTSDDPEKGALEGDRAPLVSLTKGTITRAA